MREDYIWWAAPVTVFIFVLPFVLMFFGIPMSIAMGIYSSCIIISAAIYSFKD